MFSNVMDAFDERVREIDLFCDLLTAVENGQLVNGDGSGPPHADWGPMLKGSLYLVLYNLVEAFVRRGFHEVFTAIRDDRMCGIDLIESMREQWVTQRNRKVKPLDGSANTYMKITNTIIREISRKSVAHLQKDLLPYPGTLDADHVRKMCHSHGVDVTVDPAANGGAALDTVKTKRNSLAHGDESFAECGRLATSSDLIRAKDEIVLFMRGVLESLERFAVSKAYKAAPATT